MPHEVESLGKMLPFVAHIVSGQLRVFFQNKFLMMIYFHEKNPLHLYHILKSDTVVLKHGAKYLIGIF